MIHAVDVSVFSLMCCIMTVQGASTACTISGLHGGSAYRLQVVARNASGCGPYSRLIELQTAHDVPHRPPTPRAQQRTQNALQVEWNPPDFNGGTAISSFRLELSNGERPSVASLTVWQRIIAMLHLRCWWQALLIGAFAWVTGGPSLHLRAPSRCLTCPIGARVMYGCELTRSAACRASSSRGLCTSGIVGPRAQLQDSGQWPHSRLRIPLSCCSRQRCRIISLQ